MQIAKDLAGFTPAEADDLRKAISKKVARPDGVAAREVPRRLRGQRRRRTPSAVSLWEENERSADYSFNKAHAACYAMIAYRTAYLKANHPEPYMAALISLGHADEGQGAVLRQRVRRDGHRGAAARRQQLGRGLHRRRGAHPLRAHRRQGRGGGRGARHRLRARGGRARSRRSGTSASASTPRRSTSAVLESLDQVRRARLDRRDARRDAGGAREPLRPAGQKSQADALAGQASIFDLGGDGATRRSRSATTRP